MLSKSSVNNFGPPTQTKGRLSGSRNLIPQAHCGAHGLGDDRACATSGAASVTANPTGSPIGSLLVSSHLWSTKNAHIAGVVMPPQRGSPLNQRPDRLSFALHYAHTCAQEMYLGLPRRRRRSLAPSHRCRSARTAVSRTGGQGGQAESRRTLSEVEVWAKTKGYRLEHVAAEALLRQGITRSPGRPTSMRRRERSTSSAR